MIKPDSLAELSRHLRLIWLEEATVAVKFDGATGGVGLPACSGEVQIKLRIPSKNRRRPGVEMEDRAAWCRSEELSSRSTVLPAARSLVLSTAKMVVFFFMCLNLFKGPFVIFTTHNRRPA